MINAIFDGIMSVILTLLNTAMTPINLLFEELFPDMTQAISTFNTFVTTYLGSTLSYFFSILPPIFSNLLIIWFTFLIAYYSIYFSYNLLLKVFEVIQKIKFW